MREWTKGLVKKVTLEIVYEIVDERTKDIYRKLERIEERQEEDFKYLNQKIDQLNQKIDIQIGQLRQEVKEEIGQLRQELDRINQRLDTIMQVLMDIVRK